MADEATELVKHSVNQLAERIAKLEKAMNEHVTGSNGTPGTLQTAIKRKAGSEDMDKRLSAITNALEANGKFDVASREMIEAINQILMGDELSPGLRVKLDSIEQKSREYDSVVLKVNGDGTESNKGLADRFVVVEAASKASETMAKTVGYIAGFIGLTVAGFFWNYLSGGIASNSAEIAALKEQVNAAKVQRAEDVGDLNSLKTKVETDREWAEKALNYLKK